VQTEVFQLSHLKDSSNYILQGKKNGPVVLPDMILCSFGAATNNVRKVIGVFLGSGNSQPHLQ
jgi:hypothetical protein